MTTSPMLPALPAPGPEYDQRVMNVLVNSLRQSFAAFSNPGPIGGTTLNLTDLSVGNSGLRPGDVFIESGYLKIVSSSVVITVPGTTLELSDAYDGRKIRFTSESDIIVTCPGTLPEGFSVTMFQIGGGRINLVGGSGATVNHISGHTRSAGQWAIIGIEVQENTDGLTASCILGGMTAPP